ncbi:hypothetical protein GGG16DRAFT_129123 [Schizophyllum commune]
MPKATTSDQPVASGSRSRSGKPTSRLPYGDKNHRPAKAAARTEPFSDQRFARKHGRYYYDTFISSCATAAQFLLLLQEAPWREDLTEIYGVDMLDVLPIDGDARLRRVVRNALACPIVAHRLRDLVLRGNNSERDSRTDLADALRGVILPDLETIKILRKGYSCRYFEEAAFDLLTVCGETGKLKHVCLQWHCTYEAGFTKWLESDAAANLVTLRLQTKANVRSRITDALKSGHWFPKLRRLSLVNIQGLTAEVLLGTLKARYEHGLRRRLDVEITGEVPKDVVMAARDIKVVFRTVDETLLEKAMDH